MKFRTAIGCAIALSLLVAATGVNAQVGGLLRKKAGEVLKPKPAPTETKPAPEPTPTPSKPRRW
jgi:hypothetical protein